MLSCRCCCYCFSLSAAYWFLIASSDFDTTEVGVRAAAPPAMKSYFHFFGHDRVLFQLFDLQWRLSRESSCTQSKLLSQSYAFEICGEIQQENYKICLIPLGMQHRGVLIMVETGSELTRELAQQIGEVTIKFTYYLGIRVTSIVCERLAWKYLKNPIVVITDTAGKATDLIPQHVIMMKESEKFFRLQKLLDELGVKTTCVC
ncbi:hypothetical protein F2Q70_00000108 [Brassica cretica]|uniref:Uncharacterized protein n=1 Tax=Brassica cretica TaxID=69181 RepID=A0A8S9IUL8_BRACR|nr:hypothetical protein F2Q70_00000108 [Brassica cretica]